MRRIASPVSATATSRAAIGSKSAVSPSSTRTLETSVFGSGNRARAVALRFTDHPPRYNNGDGAVTPCSLPARRRSAWASAGPPRPIEGVHVACIATARAKRTQRRQARSPLRSAINQAKAKTYGNAVERPFADKRPAPAPNEPNAAADSSPSCLFLVCAKRTHLPNRQPFLVLSRVNRTVVPLGWTGFAPKGILHCLRAAPRESVPRGKSSP